MKKNIYFDSQVVEKIIISQNQLSVETNLNNYFQTEKFKVEEDEDVWQTYFSSKKFSKLKSFSIIESNFKNISQIQAPQLKQLYLHNIHKQAINSFLEGTFIKLTSFNIWNNEISRLPQIRAPNLRHLQVSQNRIYSIAQFAKGQYPNLKSLYLYQQNLQDKLEWINSPQLQYLNIAGSKLSQTTINQLFQKGCYKKLQQLKITTCYTKIPVFIKQGAYSNIKNMYLGNNRIMNIEVLGEIDLNSLELLSFRENFISNLKVFHKSQFTQLQDLHLFGNLISQISHLSQSYFLNSRLSIDLLRPNNQNCVDFNYVVKQNYGIVNLSLQWYKNDKLIAAYKQKKK